MIWKLLRFTTETIHMDFFAGDTGKTALSLRHFAFSEWMENVGYCGEILGSWKEKLSKEKDFGKLINS